MSRSDVETAKLRDLAEQLRALHHGDLLVLPNAWDAGSARVVAEAGFPVVATASAAITAMLGLPDGEGAPWQEMFAANARIARSVAVPVSMDAEGGYGMSPADLVDRLLDIGVVGCNIEDTDHIRGGLIDAEQRASWLAEVRAAANVAEVPLVINARVDTFLPTSGIADEDRTEEAIRRGRLYREAGADCIYPIGISDPEAIRALVTAIDGPINANTSPGLDLRALKDLGVARVSYGPRFYRAGLASFGDAIRILS